MQKSTNENMQKIQKEKKWIKVCERVFCIENPDLLWLPERLDSMQLHSAHKKALNKTKSLGCYSINDDIKALWAMWAVTKISLQENR